MYASQMSYRSKYVLFPTFAVVKPDAARFTSFVVDRVQRKHPTVSLKHYASFVVVYTYGVALVSYF